MASSTAGSAARSPTAAASPPLSHGETDTTSPASRARSVVAGSPISLLGLGLALGAILLLHYAALTFRPAGSDWSTFWPASGVAVAVASRFPGRTSWPVVAAIGGVSAIGSLLAGRELLLVVSGGLSVILEVLVARRILRTAEDREPRLDTTRDLVRLFLAAPAGAATIALVGGALAVISRGPEVFLPLVLSAGPAHAVGILLVAPLLLPFSRVPRGAGRLERAACCLALLGVLWVAFGIDFGLSMVFLLIAPLAWAAVRLERLRFQWMMLATATVASASSYLDHGPFVAEGVSISVSALAIQLFDLSFGLALLTLIIVVTQRQRLAETVQESEELFRTTFDSSLVGMAIVSRRDGVLTPERMNPTARAILGFAADARIDIGRHLERSSLVTLRRALAKSGSAGSTTWQGILTTTDGRMLDVKIASLSSTSLHDELSVQFLDVSARLRAEAAVKADLTRAAQVQKALLPQNLSPLEGYQVSGICVSSAAVGGDFYDWYSVDGGLAVTLGDVMGKGVGAGMIAATARAALRSARRKSDPTVAVSRASDTLDTEVGEAESFATLFHARLNAADGRFEFVDAGHGLVFVLRADGTYQILAGEDLPLGVLTGHQYRAHDEVLAPGDMLVVVSDGLLDLYDGTLATLDVLADMARRAVTPAALTEIFTELTLLDAAPDDVTVLAVRRLDSSH